MKKPIIVINLKTYKQGEAVIKLVKSIEKIDGHIIVGVQPMDIFEVSAETRLAVYSQHVDSYEPGRNTGFILPEAIKESGATGAFLNHSEHKLDFKVIKATVKRCKGLGLKTMVFASGLKEAKQIESLRPDFIVYEPPELVAGDISVSKAKPEIIEEIARRLKVPFLVGAGIKTKEDVRKSIELGASGIAVSSAITTAKNPGKALKELLAI